MQNMHMDHVFTSYFYNVRFLRPDQVPVSTACFDPQWFHDFKGPKHIFLDKRNVLNGLRAESLHPDHTCDSLCRGLETCQTKDPSSCPFLKAYRAQLAKIDKAILAKQVQALRAKLKAKLKLDVLPDIIFLVHEPPYKACSERKALQDLLECGELDISDAQKKKAKLEKHAQLF